MTVSRTPGPVESGAIGAAGTTGARPTWSPRSTWSAWSTGSAWSVRPWGAPGMTGMAGAVGVVAAAAMVLTANDDDGPVLCVWRRCTGGWCAGCGLTRAANQLARGQVGASWRLHPMAVLLTVQLVLVIGLRLARPSSFGRLTTRWLAPLAMANVALALVIWLVRLATGAIPAWGG
jgi:hypothetical protein